MTPLECVIAARELLEDVTPLWRDCGRACGGACCQSDEDGQGGVYLFPGERTLLEDADWAEVRPSAFAPLGATAVITAVPFFLPFTVPSGYTTATFLLEVA